MKFTLLFAVLLSVALPKPIYALEPPRAPLVSRAPFEWQELREGDVREIPDSRVEAHLRMELIRRATRTIDIVQYLQTDDGPVALPLMSALRDAADRGVHVRFLITATPEADIDLFKRFRSRLLSKATRAPIECLYFGPASPWSMFDAIHEKFIIVDGAHAVTGGRAYGEKYMHWLDDGFIVRGALAAQAQETYERIWAFATLQQRPRHTPVLPEGVEPPRFRHFLVPPMMALTSDQQADLDTYVSWLDEPIGLGPVTGRAHVVHFDMIQQRWMNHFPRNRAARAAQLDDTILDTLVERVERPETRQVLISSMSLIEHPRLKQALEQAAQRGVEVRMVTNGKASDAQLAPMGANWVVSLPDMLELVRAGVRIDIFEQGRGGNPWTYLHKKMAVVDGAVLIGSHNFNIPSSLYNDEADFEIEDAAFAASARERLLGQIAWAARPVTADELQNQLDHLGPPGIRQFKEWLGHVMTPLF